jgi:hypothetical protein
MMKKKEKQRSSREVTITGFVRDDDWDFEGNAIAVSIEADEEEYTVDLDGMGEELLDYVGEEVEVKCTIAQDKDGTLHIHVLDFDVISEKEDDDEGSYDYEDDDEIDEILDDEEEHSDGDNIL